MWATAFLGMATKFSEVTLAQKFREVSASAKKWEGSVAGGPMYYIQHGLGPNWKWMAVLFAALLGFTAFFTGNAIQANTMADTMLAQFGTPVWLTGIVSAAIVGAVIIGGISRIGRVTSILAPFMAVFYVGGAVTILLFNWNEVLPAFGTIFREAFNPSAGVAGTGIGAILVTLNWGVNRGLFSNEAGQGSAPIAHAAAKTDEPVSEGVVGLVEPFIDTIIIVTMTALVIIVTGSWSATVPSSMTIQGGDSSFLYATERHEPATTPEVDIVVIDGVQTPTADNVVYAWHDVPVARIFVDEAQTIPLNGVIKPAAGIAVGSDGTEYSTLYGDAPEGGAPLTMLGFRRGLSPLGDWGHYIVIFSVILFAISTAISWSYYGDRCATYLWGPKAVLPYKLVYVLMHAMGAMVAAAVAWDLGDIFLGVVILPNLIALILLSGATKEMMTSYFERKPWVENKRVHDMIKKGHAD